MSWKKRISTNDKKSNFNIIKFFKTILNLISTPFLQHHKKTKSRGNKGTGVKQGIDSILENLKEQPPAIHDIKLKFDGNNLYKILDDGTRDIHSNNKGIFLEPLSWGNVSAKIAVYPKTVSIDLGCTFQPYPYSYGGAIEFNKSLEKIHQYLLDLSQNRVQLPPIGSWIIKQYHFGKDGKIEYSGEMFNITWEEFESRIKRFYSKTMLDGRIIPRLEEIVVPNRTVEEEIKLMETPLIEEL